MRQSLDDPSGHSPLDLWIAGFRILGLILRRFYLCPSNKSMDKRTHSTQQTITTPTVTVTVSVPVFPALSLAILSPLSLLFSALLVIPYSPRYPSDLTVVKLPPKPHSDPT